MKALIALTGLFLCMVPMPGQQLKVKQISLEQFPIIELTISIESDWGAPIPVDTAGLSLTEDGLAVGDLTVRAQDSVPVPIHTVIVLDKSGSMKGQAMEQARIGATRFVDMMRGEDKSAYITFDTQVNLVEDFSMDRERLKEKIMATRPGSDTALLNAVYQALELFAASPQEGVRLVLLLTDGRENKSQRTMDEVLTLASGQNCSIFTIGLGDQIQSQMLKELAVRTEGNYYPALDPSQLKTIYEQISLLLHSQLNLRFTTSKEMDDQWRKLKIDVPYMGRVISGERAYLSAKASRMPDALLQRIDQQQSGNRLPPALPEPKPSDPDEGRPLVIVLLAVLAGLVLVLVLVLLLKRTAP